MKRFLLVALIALAAAAIDPREANAYPLTCGVVVVPPDYMEPGFLNIRYGPGTEYPIQWEANNMDIVWVWTPIDMVSWVPVYKVAYSTSGYTTWSPIYSGWVNSYYLRQVPCPWYP